MFEKEAEEYIKVNNLEWELECNRTSPIGEVNQAFQKGAEFGYNKANEWHYVKDGDLPPEDTKVLAFMAGGEVCIAHFYRKNVWDKIGIVIAWKEIVLPKEIKENDW